MCSLTALSRTCGLQSVGARLFPGEQRGGVGGRGGLHRAGQKRRDSQRGAGRMSEVGQGQDGAGWGRTLEVQPARRAGKEQDTEAKK